VVVSGFTSLRRLRLHTFSAIRERHGIPAPPSLPRHRFGTRHLRHPRYVPFAIPSSSADRPPDLPVWLKTSGKFIISLPFFFHSYNGIRHLVWDTGRGGYIDSDYRYPADLFYLAMTLKGVYSTGYAVLAATAVSSVVAAFFL
jgi:hypothetical protein